MAHTAQFGADWYKPVSLYYDWNRRYIQNRYRGIQYRYLDLDIYFKIPIDATFGISMDFFFLCEELKMAENWNKMCPDIKQLVPR